MNIQEKQSKDIVDVNGNVYKSTKDNRTIQFIKNNIRAKDKYSFKSDFGKIALFAGSRGFTGAAYISTQAAVKCGSGLTTLVTDSYVQDIASQKLCEAMTLNIAENQKVINLIKDCDAIGFGCGMGDNEDRKSVV